MDRRTFVSASALGLAVASLPARGQTSGAVPRIGVLVPGAGASESGFMRGLRELG